MKTSAWNPGLEVRSFHVDEVLLEERADGPTVVRGLGVPYGKKSQDMGGWQETIEPGAAARSLERNNIAMLWQHDPAHPISKVRAKRNALVLKETERGVEFEQPAEAFTDEQLRRIQDGVVSEMSFGFFVRKKEHEAWEEQAGGKFLRRVKEMDLLEISPVTFAAYNSTKVAARCARAHGIALPGCDDPSDEDVAAFLRHQDAKLRAAVGGV